MFYSDFTTLTKIRESFNITVNEITDLFAEIQSIEPSDYLKITLAEFVPLANAINTEKARSELIIAPILLEIRRIFNFKIGFFSGTEFSVDPEHGLSGFCDYILTASSDIYEIRTPIITLVEAQNENIKGGLGQCISEMIAAQRFNRRENDSISAIYGSVTNGAIWKFLKLVDDTVYIDISDYYINEVNKIIGILAHPFQDYFAAR